MQVEHPIINCTEPTMNEFIHNKAKVWYANIALVDLSHLTSVIKGKSSREVGVPIEKINTADVSHIANHANDKKAEISGKKNTSMLTCKY